jgi:hypothetical protein
VGEGETVGRGWSRSVAGSKGWSDPSGRAKGASGVAGVPAAGSAASRPAPGRS